MDPTQESREEKIVFCDDGGRPQINSYQNCPKFLPNDYVYIINPPRNGSFRIKDGRQNTYRLLDGRGQLLDGGKWFKESDLRLEDDDAF